MTRTRIMEYEGGKYILVIALELEEMGKFIKLLEKGYEQVAVVGVSDILLRRIEQ